MRTFQLSAGKDHGNTVCVLASESNQEKGTDGNGAIDARTEEGYLEEWEGKGEAVPVVDRAPGGYAGRTEKTSGVLVHIVTEHAGKLSVIRRWQALSGRALPVRLAPAQSCAAGAIVPRWRYFARPLCPSASMLTLKATPRPTT
jgi:hypothetical protein